jgi:hypothetical protein
MRTLETQNSGVGYQQPAPPRSSNRVIIPSSALLNARHNSNSQSGVASRAASNNQVRNEQNSNSFRSRDSSSEEGGDKRV